MLRTTATESVSPSTVTYCRCHWREDLHLPTAFPWDLSEPGLRSMMGGRFWRENEDGTFTLLNGYGAAGRSGSTSTGWAWASSAESVGEFWFGQVAKCMI